jgi:hypothetical protein
MARSVPLSRFTSRVGGGSAFFVRQQESVTQFYGKRQRHDQLFLLQALLA